MGFGGIPMIFIWVLEAYLEFHGVVEADLVLARATAPNTKYEWPPL